MAGAEDSYRRAVQLKPGDYQAHSRLGWVQIEQLKLDEAEHALRRAVELDPDGATDFTHLGHVLREQGRDGGIRSRPTSRRWRLIRG